MSTIKARQGQPQSARKASSQAQSSPKNVQTVPRTLEDVRYGIEAQLSKSKAIKAEKTKGKQKKEVEPLKNSEEVVRGKKRSREGKVIENQATRRKSPPQPDEGDFETEVRALGGTNEDIELLQDAQSDSEVEGAAYINSSTSTSKPANDLEKGLGNILKEIALSQGQQETSDITDTSSEPDEETKSPPPAPPQPTKNAAIKKGKSKLKVEPRPDWYFIVKDLDVSDPANNMSASSHLISQVQKHAEALLKEENEAYRHQQQSTSSQSFYNTVITSGTLSDKISALTLAAQESPLHNVKALETLITLSKKRSRAQAVDVLRALKDLFAQGSLLPGSRRLYAFNTQPALLSAFATKKTWIAQERLPKGIEEQHLIVWAFENWLKDQYFEILKTLEVWCNDEIEFAKSRAISYVYELLKEKPEQESNLLRLLVNKLGDPVKKIASQASYLLRELLQVHPAMKSIVVSAIETDFMFRPGQSLHGKYYATVTINQTVLSNDQEALVIKLLNIYFSLFTTLLKTIENPPDTTNEQSFSRGQRRRGKKEPASGQAQSDDLREKLTSAILTGVNRAYPYAGSENKSFADHLNTLFKIAHSANFNTSIQSMLLIQQLSTSHQPSSDRFYRVLYESLLDPRLIVASKQQMYLNLLHRSLKVDMNSKRIKAFVKRILQILSLHEPSFICGAFFLLTDLDKTFPGLAGLFDYAEEADDEDEVFKDVDEEAAPAAARVQPQSPSGSTYDAHKRAPEHANADSSCAWEILPFLAHFHPSVALSAENYMKHTKLPGKPDLTLHTLIHFLDRFVYKNAKLSDAKMQGSSIMQPMASENVRAVLLNPTVGGKQRLPVNTEEFRAKKIDNVAAEDVFFHQYFQTAGKEIKKTKKQKKAETEESGSEEEDAVWDAMMKSAPELDMDEDEDLSMSDLDSDMGSEINGDDDAVADNQSDGSGVDVEAGIFDESDDAMSDADDGEVVPDFVDGDSEGDILDDDDDDDDVESTAAKPDIVPAKAGDTAKDRRKKLKSLPIFASADDYAKMIEDDEDKDMG